MIRPSRAIHARAVRAGLFALWVTLAAACGGSPEPPIDDVTEEWTSGDDEVLEGPDDE